MQGNSPVAAAARQVNGEVFGAMLTLRSNREIRLMRRAGLVVWLAHQEAAKHVRPGATTAQIDAAVASVFQRFDATPLFLNFPGPVPFPAVTCISVNDEVVHGIPGPRVLQPGDVVSIDTGCRVNGWCGDAAVTHPVGEIAPRTRQLLDVTSGVLQLAIDLLGAKQRWSEVAGRMDEMVIAAGFSSVRQFVGHGIGREMHEEPQVPNYVSDELLKEDIAIRPGLVLAIEPMVNLGRADVECLDDQWTQVTQDGQPSAHFEHTVAVTREGVRVLTAPPSTDEEFEFLGITPP